MEGSVRYSIQRIVRRHHLRPEIGARWQEVDRASTYYQARDYCYPGNTRQHFIYRVLPRSEPKERPR